MKQCKGTGIKLLILLCLGLSYARSQQVLQQTKPQESDLEVSANFPYYLQSPLIPTVAPNYETTNSDQKFEQRSVKSARPKQHTGPRKLSLNNQNVGTSPNFLEASNVNEPLARPASEVCLYDKRYFAKLDECLARKPYPTVGLVAFRNEDLLVKRGFSEKYGCSFILNNGLFKNYQINKFFVDSDSQCLDGNKVSLSIGFSNVTLTYLWSLRCLNRADQLLDDSTLVGEASKFGENTSGIGEESIKSQESDICIGSSQNFGFSSLQLNGLEAQVELFTDLYKNWRVTNVTVGMLNPTQFSSRAMPSSNENHSDELVGTNIKDYAFESLDGDELNWRYLHLFKNWSRNRMHTNFLDQYRRFLWISLQRCLSESAEKLPTKVLDVLANQRYI